MFLNVVGGGGEGAGSILEKAVVPKAPTTYYPNETIREKIMRRFISPNQFIIRKR